VVLVAVSGRSHAPGSLDTTIQALDVTAKTIRRCWQIRGRLDAYRFQASRLRALTADLNPAFRDKVT
jgi:hypothetical protein